MVEQFHFTDWPEDGPRPQTSTILSFREKIKTSDDYATGPLIVHCR